MKLKTLLGLSFLSLFTMSCEQEELVEPKSVAPAVTTVSDATYITSIDASRKNLLAEESFDPSLSKIFGRQVYSTYGFGVTTSLSKNNSQAVRLELRNDKSAVRSEIYYGQPTPSTGWYGLSLYLPSDTWQNETDSDAWEIITQFHGTTDSGDGTRVPPISLSVLKGRFVLTINYSAKRFNTTPDGRVRYDLGPVVKDKWLDFVYNIKYSYKADGQLRLWMNGNKVVDYTGPNTYNDAVNPHFKMGVYKRNWSKGSKRVIYFDDVRIGDSKATYNDVAPKASNVVSPPPVEKPDTSQPLTLTLMNADTHLPIQPLTNGAILDLAKLPTRNLNILATSSKTIGSIVFSLSGAQVSNSMQSSAPYSVFGDSGGKYLTWTPVAGTYSLVSTAYAGINGTGTANVPLTVNFQVIDQVTPPTETVPPTVALTINNDAVATNSASVTLNINATGATEMRFYDDNDDDIWGTWEPVATTKNWVLSAGTGPKWIKVQVRNAAGQESEATFDSINLE
ncbi:heparin lyase I family protein [Adhaeribacter swui]|uniref:Heparin lyase I family protein n=1 Tax=Adhaeribacter swui TaxID=2086471 RepID=A0A7G7G4B9_9BACT|nr:polysaccharide lyase [Adhaeribacter swui]QNF32003.1 heparin lyase I family protein [Adhaeribacter swui]